MLVHAVVVAINDLGTAMANSTGRDEQVSIRLSAKLRSQLEQLAVAEDRSLSSQIRHIVVRALEHRGADQVAA
jgi:hypothetical protein